MYVYTCCPAKAGAVLARTLRPTAPTITAARVMGRPLRSPRLPTVGLCEPTGMSSDHQVFRLIDTPKTPETACGLLTAKMVSELAERLRKTRSDLAPSWTQCLPPQRGGSISLSGDTVALAVDLGCERMVDRTHQVEPRNADDDRNGRERDDQSALQRVGSFGQGDKRAS